MFLEDFDTPAQRFQKIQGYLRETYNCEIANDKLTYTQVSKLLRQTNERLAKLDERKNPKEYSKFKLIAEGLKLWRISPYQTELTSPAMPDMVKEAIDEENVEEAKVVIAAEDMTNRLQKIIEQLAEMQVQDLIPLIDAMKADMGVEQASQFNDTVDAAFSELLDAAKATKDKLANAILVASGQAVGGQNDMSTGGTDIGPSLDTPDAEIGPELDSGLDDAFGGDDAVAGDFGPEGRKMKGESIEFTKALSEMKNSMKNGKISKKTLESLVSKVKSKK